MKEKKDMEMTQNDNSMDSSFTPRTSTKRKKSAAERIGIKGKR